MDGEPVVGQGESKVKLKDDRSPKRKKRKVSKVTIIESEMKAEVVVMMAKPEARPQSKVRTGPVRVLSEAAQGSRFTQALWSIAANLRAI